MKKILFSAVFALLAVPAFASAATLNVVSNTTDASYYNVVTKAADRLVALQDGTGGWDWDVTGKTGPTGTTYLNVTGVSAEALLSAYTLTGNVTYLDAAKKAGDFIITGTDISSPKKINGYNLVFLKKLSTVSGDASYATKAAEYFGIVYSSTPTSLCASGCADTTGLYAGYRAYRGFSSSTPNGIVAWDLASFVEYAILVGDSVHANELEAAIVDSLSIATPSEASYDLGLASGLKAASLVGDASSTAAFSLALSTPSNGAFGTNADGKVQTTAYVLNAFNQTQDARNVASANYLVTAFNSSINGWIETDSVEYAESDSEAASAVASMLPATVKYYSIQSAVDTAVTGDTVVLNDDMTVAAQVNISKAITLDGNGHTLFAPFPFVSTSNNAAIGITHSGVTIKNLIEDGTGSTGSRHGINIFEATSSVVLDGVTVKNNAASGVTVNGSNVTVNNITTINNKWGGINADQAADAPDPTVLTVSGTSSHTENSAIWVDNNLRNVTINDVSNQYASTTYPSSSTVTGRYYVLKSVTVNNETQLRAALNNPLISNIMFGSDITTAAQLDIVRAVTIDGASHTLKAPFTGVKNTSDSAIHIAANNVTIKNLIEDGTGTTANRGINIYRVNGILLDHVTASNNSKNGIVVNGSSVTVNNITTKNNGWSGIDVDKGTSAILTVNGVSSHAETNGAIFVDDITIGSVIDTNSQYSFTKTVTNGTTSRTYVLNGNISASNPQVSVISTTAPISITVDTATVNPQIDVHTLITAGSGTLPQITITSSASDVIISTSTLVAGPIGWDGMIQAPTAVSASGNAPAGFRVGNNVISVGSPSGTLTFDKAVKITLLGVTGTVGYKSAGSDNWQTITTQCAGADDHSNISSGECYFHDGANTVIWTYHFTSFGSLTAIPAPAGGSYFGGSGGSGGSSASQPAQLAVANTPATGQVLGTTTKAVISPAAKGQVLGATAFAFTRNMGIGARGIEVEELQKMLVAAGHLKLATTTKYFGPLTKAAVIKWQAANKLPSTGYFGPMSRAFTIK